MRGTIKWFNVQKGYGFITDSEGRDLFVYYSNLVMDGFKALYEDDIVNFELGSGKDGREQAINIKPIITTKMVEDSLRAENLYIQIMKDGYGVTKYLVVDEDGMIQTDEQGMDFLNLAAFAGYDIEGL